MDWSPIVLSRPARWSAALVLVQTLLLWITLHVPGLGDPAWHHLASLALVLLFSAVFWVQLVHSRRLLAIGVLAFSFLATVSGFWLLYWKEGIRVDGYQDWGVFWHVLWSWGMMVFFLLHTWINRVALFHFFRRSFSAIPPATLHGGLYIVLIVGFLVTWSTTGRTWFTNDIYIPLSLYTWVAFTVPPYVLWILLRTRRHNVISRFHRWRIRRFVDLSLVPISILAVLSGVVLAFMDPITDPNGWKYVAKYWHVWPSVAFALLAFVHSYQAWKTVRAHWRRFDWCKAGAPLPGKPALEDSAQAKVHGRSGKSDSTQDYFDSGLD